MPPTPRRTSARSPLPRAAVLTQKCNSARDRFTNEDWMRILINRTEHCAAGANTASHIGSGSRLTGFRRAATQYPSLFQTNGAPAGTSQNGQRPNTGTKTISRKDFDALDPVERHRKVVKEGTRSSTRRDRVRNRQHNPNRALPLRRQRSRRVYDLRGSTPHSGRVVP